MKSRTRHTTTVEGELSRDELVAFIAGQVAIPEGAELELWVGDDPHDIRVNLGNPLRFRYVTTHEG